MTSSNPQKANYGAARFLVVCVDINEPGFVELVEEHAGPNIELTYVGSSEPEFFKLLGDADCLLVSGGTILSERALSFSRRLKLVQLPQVGYNGVDLGAAKRHGIAVCNAPGANTSAVAEHALMLILATMRLARQHDEDIRSGRWPFMDFFDRGFGDFGGSTLGIIGLGSIGQALAAFSRPLAGEIIYYQRHKVTSEIETRLGVRYVTLDDLLRGSDAVTLHVPLTEATHGMIGSRELAQMKTSAVLVNTARGPVIDEPALVDALASGRLRGAGLDVLCEEPPPRSSPLLRLPNVLLTAHEAGGSRAVVARSIELAFTNIHRLRDGRPLTNRVDGGDADDLDINTARRALDATDHPDEAPNTTT